ncbi:MAG: PAS domain S-box protein [Saprospiraceae bacterium]|nr:PAS domain S-box protein [Saprospiraceae bacterium]
MTRPSKSQAHSTSDSEERFRSVFENQLVGILLIDAGHRIIEVNQAFCRMIGSKRSDLLEHHIDEITAPEDLATGRALIEQIHSGETKKLITDKSFVRQNGSRLQTRTMVNGIYDLQGAFQYCVATIQDLTTELEKEAALEDSEKRAHLIFQNAPDGILIFDVQSNQFLDLNPAAEQIFGYTYDQLLQMNPVDLSPKMQPDGRRSKDVIREKIVDAVAGRQPTFEWVHTPKNGEEKLIEIRLDKLPSNVDRPWVIARLTDIGERKKQELILQQSEERFRNLFQKNPLMIFAIQHNGNILAVNESAVDQLGYPEKELVGQNVLKVFHPDDKVKVQRQVLDFLNSDDKEASWELRKIKKEGEIIWVQEIARSIDWPGGDEAILITCENITRRKEAEQILKRSEERYRSVFENHLFGIVISNSDGVFEVINPAFREMLGYSSEEIYQLSAVDLTHTNDLEETRAIAEKLRKGEISSAVMEKKYLHKSSEIIYARTYVKGLYDENNFVRSISIIENITDRKVLEQRELELAKKQTELDYRNRELTSFTLFITQKNKLLASISESLEKMQSEVDPPHREKIKKLQNYIVQNTDQETDWQGFQMYFQEVNPNFFTELSTKNPSLTQNDLKHCAYVKMKLSNKEVTNLLHISPKAVEVARYRIKKKLGLQSRHQKLYDYLERL